MGDFIQAIRFCNALIFCNDPFLPEIVMKCNKKLIISDVGSIEVYVGMYVGPHSNVNLSKQVCNQSKIIVIDA